MAAIKKDTKSAYDKENNKLKLKRGTRISFEELLQFEKQKGKIIYSKGLLSTSTLLRIAKRFAGFENPIDEGWVKILIQLDVDLDFLNDYGQFLYMFSNAPTESEWLLTFGSRL